MLCFLFFIHMPSSVSKVLEGLSSLILPFLRGNVKENYDSRMKKPSNVYSFILAEKLECYFRVGLAFKINSNFHILKFGSVSHYYGI